MMETGQPELGQPNYPSMLPPSFCSVAAAQAMGSQPAGAVTDDAEEATAVEAISKQKQHTKVAKAEDSQDPLIYLAENFDGVMPFCRNASLELPS